jgi:tetratricopeptide (TPR) repeat protein
VSDAFQSLRQQAVSSLQSKRFAEALELATRALDLRPRATGMLVLRADAFAALGRHEEAVRAYRQALALKPGTARLLFACARSLKLLERHAEALAAYDRLLELKPGSAPALLNRGNALRALKRLPEAIASFRHALEAKPGYPPAHNNLGNALQTLGRYDEAVTHYEAALAGQPDYVDALNNMGNAMQMLARYPEAIGYYDRVLAQQPKLAATLWNKGTTMLHLGISREAWLLYEQRLESDLYDKLQAFGLPTLGEAPLAGRKVLVQWEARYGDVVQMLRYLPALQAACAGCWLQVAPSLRDLAARSFPQAHIVGTDEPGAADCRVPYTSLPLALKTFSEKDIPANVPYLAPDPAKVARWKSVLGAGRIGLAWRGNPVPAHRSIPFEALRPLLAAPGAKFVTLQKPLLPEERAALMQLPQVAVLEEQLETFDDTAAVIAGLDLVITIDSAIAHLAGALARPAWVLLKVGADWRWLSERADTPWYPTARLFWQENLGEWGPVIRKVCAEMAGFAAPNALTGSNTAATPSKAPAARTSARAARVGARKTIVKKAPKKKKKK